MAWTDVDEVSTRSRRHVVGTTRCNVVG